MKIEIDLNSLKNAEGHYSENDVRELERLTGKSWQQLHAEAEKGVQPEYPGHPSKWDRNTKLSFIDEHGRDAFKRLVDERK